MGNSNYKFHISYTSWPYQMRNATKIANKLKVSRRVSSRHERFRHRHNVITRSCAIHNRFLVYLRALRVHIVSASLCSLYCLFVVHFVSYSLRAARLILHQHCAFLQNLLISSVMIPLQGHVVTFETPSLIRHTLLWCFRSLSLIGTAKVRNNCTHYSDNETFTYRQFPESSQTNSKWSMAQDIVQTTPVLLFARVLLYA